MNDKGKKAKPVLKKDSDSSNGSLEEDSEDDDDEEMESDMDEEGEESMDDSEAREGMAEMLGEGIFDARSSSDESDSDEEDSDEYDSEEGEEMMDEEGEDSFEEKYGEPRFEVIEEKINPAALDSVKKNASKSKDKKNK